MGANDHLENPPFTLPFSVNNRSGQEHTEILSIMPLLRPTMAQALNRLFKYKYLPRQKRMTLSHIISSITNEFLPALHYKYVFKNFKQSDLYRSYNPSVVPAYLQGRPHCLHRLASSNKFSQSDVTQVASSQLWQI